MMPINKAMIQTDKLCFDWVDIFLLGLMGLYMLGCGVVLVFDRNVYLGKE
jgi:hypothetical protein